MEKTDRERRALAKTKAAHFLNKLQSEFDLAPRIAQAVLEEAEVCLNEPSENQAGGREMGVASRAESRSWSTHCRNGDEASLLDGGRWRRR